MSYEGGYSKTGNSILSHTTKKVYRFSNVPGSKAGFELALQAMRNDDAAHNAATTARNNGVAPTPRQVFELAHGKPKVAPPTHIGQYQDDGKMNHAAKVLGELQSMPERGKDQRSLKKKAIAAMEALALRKQAQMEAAERREEMLSDPAVQAAITHAEKRIEQMAADSAYTQTDVDEARGLAATLKAQAADPGTFETAAKDYYAGANAQSKGILARFKEAQRVQREKLEIFNEAVAKGEAEIPLIEPTPDNPPTA